MPLGCGKSVPLTLWDEVDVDTQICGSTIIDGGVSGTGISRLFLCSPCLMDAAEKFPQGWRSIPGDTCKHGSYIGNPGGIDYICGQCEMGE